MGSVTRVTPRRGRGVGLVTHVHLRGGREMGLVHLLHEVLDGVTRKLQGSPAPITVRPRIQHIPSL